MTKILSISVTDEEKQWLDDMELSPTALIKQKISEMMTSSRAQSKRIRQLEDHVVKIGQLLERKGTFIAEKNLEEEFNKWNG